MAHSRQAHEVQLLQGGKEYFASLVLAFDASQSEVRLETYIFHIDASGCVVAEALERAAARGVQVYLMIDGFGTPRLPPEWEERFERSGVQWCIFSPLGRLGVFIPNRWRRMHRKLCVVDGAVAFCGGINVLDDYFDPNHGILAEPRLDYAVRVTGPLVEDVLAAVTRFWARRSLSSDLRSRRLPRALLALGQSVRQGLSRRLQRDAAAADGTAPGSVVPGEGARAELVLRDNWRNRRKIERAYLKAIGAARQEIVIANAYFLPGARLRRALVLAARRGVRVRLLLQGRYEYFLQYHASRPVYAALLGAGVEIHEYAASFLHAKVAVIDSRWATVGSSNLDPLSLLLAREANVVVDDGGFAGTLRDSLERAMADGGRLLDAQEFARRSWRVRALELLALAAMRAALFLLGKRY